MHGWSGVRYELARSLGTGAASVWARLETWRITLGDCLITTGRLRCLVNSERRKRYLMLQY